VSDVALVVAGGTVRVLDPVFIRALGSQACEGEVIESAGVARWLRTKAADRPVVTALAERAPVVSVIVPTYNRDALLREAIASVMAQTFTDWELIVADDGSTDGTRTYLESLRDPRVRPLFLEHRGTPTHPRIAALEAVRGQWVAFIDSDDLWLPDKLARQLSEVAEHPRCRWSYTGYRIVNGQGAAIAPRPPTPFLARSGWILEDLLTYTVSASIVTVLVQRSLLAEVGGFDDTLDFRSDFDLALRLAARSEAWAVAETLAVVRDHPGRSTSQQPPAELFRSNARVFRKASASAPNRRIKAVCIRQCASQLAEMARRLSLEGEHRAAFAGIAGALRESPLSPALWRAGAGSVARALGWRRTR
jgi:GT2 family glycosyltransferase